MLSHAPFDRRFLVISKHVGQFYQEPWPLQARAKNSGEMGGLASTSGNWRELLGTFKEALRDQESRQTAAKTRCQSPEVPPWPTPRTRPRAVATRQSRTVPFSGRRGRRRKRRWRQGPAKAAPSPPARRGANDEDPWRLPVRW